MSSRPFGSPLDVLVILMVLIRQLSLLALAFLIASPVTFAIPLLLHPLSEHVHQEERPQLVDSRSVHIRTHEPWLKRNDLNSTPSVTRRDVVDEGGNGNGNGNGRLYGSTALISDLGMEGNGPSNKFPIAPVTIAMVIFFGEHPQSCRSVTRSIGWLGWWIGSLCAFASTYAPCGVIRGDPGVCPGF